MINALVGGDVGVGGESQTRPGRCKLSRVVHGVVVRAVQQRKKMSSSSLLSGVCRGWRLVGLGNAIGVNNNASSGPRIRAVSSSLCDKLWETAARMKGPQRCDMWCGGAARRFGCSQRMHMGA